MQKDLISSCNELWKFPPFILYQQNMPCFSNAVNYLSFQLERIFLFFFKFPKCNGIEDYYVKNMLTYNNTRKHILALLLPQRF